MFDPEIPDMGRLIGSCGHLAKQYMVICLRRHGYNVTPPQTQALQLLSCAGRELSQRELEQAMGLKAPTVNGIVIRLEEKGLITRRPSPADGRCRLLRLTEEGEQMVESFHSAVEEMGQILLSGLTGEEQAQFRALLLRIIANLENEVNRA